MNLYKYKQDKLEKAIEFYKSHKPKRQKNIEGLYFERIVEIKDIGSNEVYNLTAKNKHNYIANGIVTHNTNAPIIRLGTAGYKLCEFYNVVEKKPAPVTFKYYCYDIIKMRQKRYEEDGNEMHLKYEQHVKKREYKLGKDNDEFRTQYLLEWVIGVGQFITQEKLHLLRDDNLKFVKELNDSFDKYFGLDTAKSQDRTVLTIIRDTGLRLEEIGKLFIEGDNYEDQYEMIVGLLGKFNNVRAGAIDSTGQGDFMPDKFTKYTKWKDGSGLFRVKFGLQTKDILYKDYGMVLRRKGYAYPNPEKLENVEDRKMVEIFEQEHIDLQKEHKGIYLSCHHPDKPGAKDDTADSAALAVWAWKNHQSATGGLYDYHKKLAGQQAQSGALQEILRLMSTGNFDKLT